MCNEAALMLCTYCRHTKHLNVEGSRNFGNPVVIPSRKLLSIKVTPDLHLTYSKNGGNLRLVLKMKNIACISILYIYIDKTCKIYLFIFV